MAINDGTPRDDRVRVAFEDDKDRHARIANRHALEDVRPVVGEKV